MIAVLRVMFLTLVCLSTPGWGAQLGDRAKPLQVAEWVNGGPIDLAAGRGEKIFVVEFWATWCPPCLTSIPHLTRLQQKHRKDGVEVIGVTDESGPEVREFVKKMGGKMNYAVALDNEGATGAAYMRAYGVTGIPHAFVVDKVGRVVWSGHPEDGLDAVLDQVVAGDFDLELARKRERGRALFAEFYELAATNGDKGKLSELAQELTALDKETGGITPGQPFDASRVRKASRFEYLLTAYEEAFQQGTPMEEIEQVGRDLRSVSPPGFEFAEFKQSLLLSRLFVNYYAAATEGSKADAMAHSNRMLDVKSRNALVMNDIAWTMLTDDAIRHRNVAVALVLAERAFEVSGKKSSNIADTYARALFDSGKIEEAIDYGRIALELCEDPELRVELEATLARYRASR